MTKDHIQRIHSDANPMEGLDQLNEDAEAQKNNVSNTDSQRGTCLKEKIIHDRKFYLISKTTNSILQCSYILKNKTLQSNEKQNPTLYDSLRN